MFAFLRKLCGCETLEDRQKRAVRQDRRVRDQMTDKDYDKDVKSTMAASDPITRY